jgi:hypothetical protein
VRATIRLEIRARSDPVQPAVSVACADAFIPFAWPNGGGLAIVISRSSTGALMPAASMTVTIR